MSKSPKKDLDQVAALDAAIGGLVSAAGPLQSWGDGNCGYVMDRIKETLRAAGLYSAGSYIRPKKTIPQWMRTQVFERDAYRCRQCGSWQKLHADHVIPESKGGETSIDNLQTLCAVCNLAKGARL